MLNEVEFEVVYTSGEKEPSEFFIDALTNSSRFDFGLGFFNSSGFRALAIGFAYFISCGGKMRMIINDELTSQDKEAIQKGIYSSPEEVIEKRLVENFNALRESLSSYDQHFYNCLSWMVASKTLEIIAITPNSEKGGLAHQKFGIFYDSANNKIAFNGSANFSKSALQHNLETLSCFTSWNQDSSDYKRIEYFRSLFNAYWEGTSPAIRKIPIESVREKLKGHSNVKNVDELLYAEKKLLEITAHNSGYRDKLAGLTKGESTGESDFEYPIQQPKLPASITKLFDYQIQALENWKASGYQGLFEMATGTGKTITALNCALEMYREENKVGVIVLVPTIDLAEQWKGEVVSFGFTNVVLANSQYTNWYSEAIQLLNRFYFAGGHFIIISTYDTFSLDKFQNLLSKVKKDILLIADEVHNFGTKKLIENYPYHIERRIGLSATPARYFDEDGTIEIQKFFNAINGPTISLDLKEAIDRKFLTQYYYYPRIVKLTEPEMTDYREITEKLMKFFNPATRSFSDHPVVSILLNKRKAILHKAENKTQCLREIIKEIVSQNPDPKYILVYVPEGREGTVDEEDKRLINTYSEIISSEFNLKQHQFIGETKNRKQILERFSQGRLQVLTAMKCLDEGIDVRQTETAIFASSTGNYRQFVQRRGRILRLCKGKNFATIYDMVVIPSLSGEENKEELSLGKKIIEGELKRVREFANGAINKYTALGSLENVLSNFHIEIFESL
ncbi:MAG: DEAD/DEAH box helicase family protein [Ignavibacteria bacterium]|nr:DEAD/DEAH box helicase family protein [Ignavibacteria bacterium]